MAVTLAQAKVGMADKVDQAVIDMFQRSSLLLDRLTFDDSISPGTGGSTLTYGYIQLKTPSQAGVRAINSEFTPGEAEREEKTTAAIIMGGSFQVDRVLQNTSGAIDELSFQAEEKIKATSNEFHNLVINGAKASPASGFVAGTFDGLRKLLAGTSNEFTSSLDIADDEDLAASYNQLLDEVDALVAAVDGGADLLLMNKKMLLKLRSAARRAGYYERNKDDFGRTVETFSGIPMLDLGKYYNGSASVDVVETAVATGKTSIFAVKLGLDAFHGISPMGGKMINSYMPDLKQPGAVKTGEVELVAGVALKNTLKAAVLGGIKIVNP
jgi:hypothetical protein